MRHIDEIIIHCSATAPGWYASRSVDEKCNEIRRWHMQDRGWSDIGYHRVIDKSGSIAIGRPVDRAGAHCKGHNANSIGICLIGGRGASADDKWQDHFTPQQMIRLRQEIARLRQRFPTIKKISGHNQYAAKGCPGFIVAEWLAEDQPQPKPAANWLRPLLDFIADLFRKERS